MPAKRASQWILNPNGGVAGLQIEENVSIPDVTGRQCLVRIEAVSLNYRDIAMAFGRYPLPLTNSFVPCSDGAGQIVAKGTQVTEFQVGDKVCMSFMQDHQDGIVTPKIRQSSLGSQRDGVLRQYGIFEETGLVLLPKSLSFAEGSTLPCAAVTAWNCLFGLESRSLKKGDVLLTQGTGGVSIFAIQFALAIGATVISTTSTSEKEEKLKQLGVHHVLNYKSNLDWGVEAKSLTPDGLGVHHVIEVGGEATIPQSLKAIRPEGVVSMVGFLGGKSNSPASFSLIQNALCIIRGINVGSRKMFQDMNSFVEANGIKPIVSNRMFGFQEAREAYQYLEKQDFWGKTVIHI
ncbi:hypothetical protein V502_05442 [Pseudogymnoascus sp. VKM F-4520 (FW-2644)]|nr:hypothetical protein V502_05442 [Pseudogymnoascus sp. VKM F-4520 (FW-2644)]